MVLENYTSEKLENMNQEATWRFTAFREGHFDGGIKGWLHRPQQDWENPTKEQNTGVSS